MSSGSWAVMAPVPSTSKALIESFEKFVAYSWSVLQVAIVALGSTRLVRVCPGVRTRGRLASRARAPPTPTWNVSTSRRLPLPDTYTVPPSGEALTPAMVAPATVTELGVSRDSAPVMLLIPN